MFTRNSRVSTLTGLLAIQFFVSFLPTPVGAADFSEAKDHVDTAKDDYFKGLIQLGPTATGDQKKALWEKTMAPALKEQGQAERQMSSSVRDNISTSVWSYYKNVMKAAMPDWLRPLARAAGITNFSGNPAAPESGVTRASVRPSARPPAAPAEEQGMDVSGVERSFTFKGKAKASPSPKPVWQGMEVPPPPRGKKPSSDEGQSFSFP